MHPFIHLLVDELDSYRNLLSSYFFLSCFGLIPCLPLVSSTMAETDDEETKKWVDAQTKVCCAVQLLCTAQ